MNSDILDRYDITSDNRFIIDVNAPDSGDLFETYDSNASFYKKDLNVRLEDYLLECAEEIGLKNKFIIRIGLPEKKAPDTDEGDITFSFRQYFRYCAQTCRKEIRTITLRMVFHLGLAAVALAVFMISGMFDNAQGGGSAITSGLPTAIWVLLLTGFSRFLYRVKIQRAQIKKYDALMETPMDFRYTGEHQQK